MEKTIQAVRTYSAPILYSTKAVLADDIPREIPAGCRQASANDIALRYFHNADFREELCKVKDIWTADKSSSRTGTFRLCEDGSFAPVSSREFMLLPEEQQAVHYAGIGQVIVGCYKNDSGKVKLYLNAEYRLSRTARVAYLKDENVQPPQKEGICAVQIPIGEIDAAREALRKVEPYLSRIPQTGEFIELMAAVRKILRDRT